MILKSENINGVFRIYEGSKVIADVNIDTITHDADYEYELQNYSLYLEGIFWGKYIMERGDLAIVNARKKWFSNCYRIQFDNVNYFFDHKSILYRNGDSIGSIYCDLDGIVFPKEIITVAFSNDVPMELKLFCFWLYKRRRTGEGPS